MKISASIELRAIELMQSGIDPVSAVKQALIDENNFIGSLLGSGGYLSPKGERASDVLLNRYINTLPA